MRSYDIMKFLTALFLSILFILTIFSLAEDTAIPSSAKTSISFEHISESFSVCFEEPTGCDSLNYYLLSDDNIVEMVFHIDHVKYTARAKHTDSFEDITDIHINWNMEYTVPISNFEGSLLYGFTDTEILSAFLWFDEVRGMMCSVSCTHDYNSVSDVYVVAELIYLPPEEITCSASVDTETIHNLILSIASEQNTSINACSLVLTAVESQIQTDNDIEIRQTCIDFFGSMSESDFLAFKTHFSQAKDALLSENVHPSDIAALFSEDGFGDDVHTYVNDRVFKVWVNFIYVIDSAIDYFIQPAENY